MLGTGRLLTFALRALALVVVVPILWLTVATRYNSVLASASEALLPGSYSVGVAGSHILFEHDDLAVPVSIDGYTLHYGLILVTILVLAAVGIGLVPRLVSLVAMGAGVLVLHVVGVTLLAVGVAWAANGDDTLVFSVFAVFWGLLPAALGGAWSVMYWIPRATSASQVEAPETDTVGPTPNVGAEGEPNGQ